jgi:alcohol dehydrogenase class IV
VDGNTNGNRQNLSWLAIQAGFIAAILDWKYLKQILHDEEEPDEEKSHVWNGRAGHGVRSANAGGSHAMEHSPSRFYVPLIQSTNGGPGGLP